MFSSVPKASAVYPEEMLTRAPETAPFLCPTPRWSLPSSRTGSEGSAQHNFQRLFRWFDSWASPYNQIRNDTHKELDSFRINMLNVLFRLLAAIMYAFHQMTI